MALAPESNKAIPRHELIAAALELGIPRPESLTESELATRIRQVSEGSSGRASEPDWTSSGWFAVARHLVANVVERGLHLPTAARVLRDSVRPSPPSQRPPLPTVTLAQIYIAQGHPERARATLTQVLRRDPTHPKAQRLLAELEARADGGGGSTKPQGRSGLAEASHPLAPSDAVVVLRTSRGVSVYWELGERSRREQSPEQDANRVQRSSSRGPELWISCFTPTPRGAQRREERHALTRATGRIEVECDPDVVVRAALGISKGERRVPSCVASAYRLDVNGLDLEFRPRKRQNDAEVAERARRA